LITGLVAVALCLPAAEAGAVERVRDGSFDAMTSCAGGNCTSPVWSPAGELVFLCGPGGRSGCAGYGPALSGSYYALFGDGYVENDPCCGSPNLRSFGYLAQRVPIPAAPAVLRYQLRRSAGAGTVTLAVRLDGQVISTPPTSGVTSYPHTQFEVDVSQFAGPGAHDLRFEFTCAATCGGLNLDNVSLDAADLPEPEPEPISPPTCAGQAATIIGGEEGETIRGTAGADVIVVFGGNDIVEGAGGPDLICGGLGNDRLKGQGAKDRIFGDEGKDILGGGRGRGDLCEGGAGNDRAGGSCEKVPA
jgi:hypothetical protein